MAGEIRFSATPGEAPTCCGQPMEGYPGAEPWGMMDFDHDYTVDYECLSCGKEIFDVPAA
ncbi:MAG: hypothetical protein LC650_00245 [Actinobacteria bacterium]|nr:hypothetical protein [Actinomycetota bacterium]